MRINDVIFVYALTQCDSRKVSLFLIATRAHSGKKSIFPITNLSLIAPLTHPTIAVKHADQVLIFLKTKNSWSCVPA